MARAGLVGALVVAMSVLHIVTPPESHTVHEWLFKATYVQIILAGLWFGLLGGLGVSALTSVVYILHIRLQLQGHHDALATYSDLVLYNVIGCLSGILSDGSRRALRKLSEAHGELKEKTATLLLAEESLKEAERLRALGEVAASVAHEIRTPLGGIGGAADIICDPATREAEKEEFRAILKKECERLNRFVESFLSFSRPSEAEAPVFVEVARVLDDVLLILSGPIAEQGIEVSKQVDRGLRARADPPLLRQALLNLVLNAIQAMPGGGTLSLGAEIGDGVVHVDVTDDGPGVPDALRPRLFQPFVTARAGGTGLGLAVTRRVVMGMGGAVALLSDRSRTTFRITLPDADPFQPGSGPEA